MKIIIVNVTARDIQRGKTCDSIGCPIYHAIRRRVMGFVSVGATYVSLKHGGDVDLPQEACKFILRFDCEKKVKPFKFPLTIP